MSRKIAFSLFLSLICIQSLNEQHLFASGFELKKLLNNQKISLNDDVLNFKHGLNIENTGNEIQSRGGKLKSKDKLVFRIMVKFVPLSFPNI